MKIKISKKHLNLGKNLEILKHAKALDHRGKEHCSYRFLENSYCKNLYKSNL